MKQKLAKITVLTSAIGGLLAVGTQNAFAATQIIPDDLKPINDPGPILEKIIRLILAVSFVLAFIFLIIGGIRWILAGGDKTKVEGARGMVIGSLVGLVIVILAFVLIIFVQQFFGISIIGKGTGTAQIPGFQ